MKRYTVLLLDADDTLLDFKAAEAACVKQVFEHFGRTADDMVVSRYSAINHGLWKQFERGEISKGDISSRRFTRLFEELEVSEDGIVAERFYREKLGECAFLVPGALKLCEDLSRCYPLYIITNGVSKTQYQRKREAVRSCSVILCRQTFKAPSTRESTAAGLIQTEPNARRKLRARPMKYKRSSNSILFYPFRNDVQKGEFSWQTCFLKQGLLFW